MAYRLAFLFKNDISGHSAVVFWLFSCASQVTNHFLDVCEAVKADTVGVCADRSWKGFKKCKQTHTNKSAHEQNEKGAYCACQLGDMKVRLQVVQLHLNLHKVSVERKDTVFMAAVTRCNKHHVCLFTHYQQDSSWPPAHVIHLDDDVSGKDIGLRKSPLEKVSVTQPISECSHNFHFSRLLKVNFYGMF